MSSRLNSLVAREATRVGVKRKEEKKGEKIQVTSIKTKRLNAFLLNTKFTCFGEQPVARGSVPSLSVPILAFFT